MATDVQSVVDRLLTADASHPPPDYNFSFTPYLRKTFGFGLATDVPVCKAFKEGHCPLGPTCPDRHPTPSRVTTSSTNASGLAPSVTHGSLVCKHFLKGLCKKGFKCEYLHEYNLRRMPECASFSRSGYCPNGEDCLYHHLGSVLMGSHVNMVLIHGGRTTYPNRRYGLKKQKKIWRGKEL
ncbi:hypothetical protein ZTR_04525 [Talaromyces verruculosus]|nr:hypothetical protein ZTR_04525 [Talaromyces verruculosus]